MRTLFKFVLPIALTVVIGVITRPHHTQAVQRYTLPRQSLPHSNIPSAYGFHANMNKEDFDTALKALNNNPNNPFVRGFHELSSDGEKVVAIGLAFPSAAFLQVAKEIAGENGGELTCQKMPTGVIVCHIEDSAGNEILLVNPAFVDKQRNTFGAVFIADKNHMGPAHKDTKPKDKVVLGPGQNEAMT